MVTRAIAIKKEADELYKQSQYQSAYDLYVSALQHQHVPAIYNNAAACLIGLANFPEAIFLANECLLKCAPISPKDRARAHQRAATALIRLASITPAQPTETAKLTPPSILEPLTTHLERPLPKPTFLYHLARVSNGDLIDLAIYHVYQGQAFYDNPALKSLWERLVQIKEDMIKNPSKSESLRSEGNQYVKQKNFRKAAKLYGEALKIDSGDYRLYSNRGWCYTNLKHYSLAIKDLIKCIEIQPKDYTKAHLRLSKVYASLKLFHKAVKVLDDFINVNKKAKKCETCPDCEVDVNLFKKERKKLKEEIKKWNRKGEQDKEGRERITKSKEDKEVREMMESEKVKKWMGMMEEEKKEEGRRMKEGDKELGEMLEYLENAGMLKWEIN